MSDWLQANKDALLAEQEAALKLIKAGVELEAAKMERLIECSTLDQYIRILTSGHQHADRDCDECRKDRGR